VSEQPVAEEVAQQPPEAPSAPSAPERRRALRAGLPASLQSLLVTIVIALFVITFLVQAFQIPSESMENTLLIGDYLLVDKVDYAYGGIWADILPYSKIERGDIVVFHYPVHPDQHFVKRVIGVPGDHIRMNGKQVWVNGNPLKENYAIYRSAADDAYHYHFPNADFVAAGVEARWWLQMRTLIHNGELTVPPGQYFVLGDNRDESLDSRFWGFVPRANIVGRPLLIYWSIRAPADNPIMTGGGDWSHLAYVLTHVLQTTRWHRTFRLVN
jgi:signal peptidase I